MKKSIFLMALATVAMVSCSKDEMTEVNHGKAIDFRAAMQSRAMQSRAAETTTANINEFTVTALDANSANYFTDVVFSKDGSFFTSDPAYYWPGDGSNLQFYAYSPSAVDLGGTVTINSTTKTLTGFSPAAAIADQKDFITTTATGNKTNESAGVHLIFEHRLSQIEVKAKNEHEGYVYKVTGMRIGMPVASSTSFDFSTNVWTLGTNKTDYEVEYDAIPRTLTATAESMMGIVNDNAMLLPQQLVAWDTENDKPNDNEGAYLALKIQITTKDGARVYPEVTDGDYGWAAVAINTNWEAGKKYIYTLDFSNGAGKTDPENPDPGEDILGDPIKFTVEVTEWADVSEDIEM